MFTATRTELEAYEAEPRYARAVPFIHLLLRSYSGLFSDYVIIDEKEIARRAECSPQVAVDRLNYLTRMGLVGATTSGWCIDESILYICHSFLPDI